MYGIRRYCALNEVLGERWHLRVLNERLNFCYAKLETVQFHLHKRQSLTDVQPDQDHKLIDGGFVLVFCFVRMDGLAHDWDRIIKIA